MASPLKQFEIEKIVPLEIGGIDISFTNASLWMLIAVFATIILFQFGTLRSRIVPNRLQMMCENIYHFIADMVRDTLGPKGAHFFPLIFTIFMLVFMGNALGLIPYSFTFTSHIIVTLTMALMVFFMVLVLGFIKHGTHFFSLFVPPGVPIYVLPLVVPIEIISFFARPLTLAIRLFANMIAGHIVFKVFAGFAITFAGLGATGILASALPVLFNSIMIAFELLIAFLQAYIFAILSCIYLKDTVELEH